MRQIAIFGGTFNPVHLGHLNYAGHCAAQLAFDEVLFIPTNLPPHKNAPDLASNEDRLKMLRLALEDLPGMRPSDIEYRLGGKSYTVNTLAALREEMPDAAFSLLIGSDMLYTFTEWREYESILQQARVIATARVDAEWDHLEHARHQLGKYADRVTLLPVPVFPVSSTQIRTAIQNGEDVSALLPEKVLQYIQKRGLYRAV